MALRSRVPAAATASGTPTPPRLRTARSDSRWIDNCELTLNAANLFNADPPFVNLEIGYDTANSQPLGRVLGVYVRKDW